MRPEFRPTGQRGLAATVKTRVLLEIPKPKSHPLALKPEGVVLEIRPGQPAGVLRASNFRALR